MMKAGTRLLRAADMAALLRIVGRDAFMDLMIADLRRTFADLDPGGVDVRTRDGFRYDKPDLGLIEWMPTHEVGGPVVVKMVGYHPSNPVQRDVPSVLATSSMWDTQTGHLVALADATLLTALRTGAASALAADLLAVDRPVEVGIVGLGAQAVTQLHALSRVRPVTRVRGYDSDGRAASSFAARVGFLGLDVDVVAADGLDELVGEADVLVTCTSVDIDAGPVVPDVATRPWLHVNAVGADFPGKVELPVDLLRRATVFPDSRAQCIAEGESQQLDPSTLGPELVEIVRAGPEYRSYRERPTVFDSTGWAVEDDVALRLALRLAEQHDVGTVVQIECVPSDPLDPYDLAGHDDLLVPTTAAERR